MQMHGNLVAYPVNSLDDRNDAYWASGIYNEGPGVQFKLTRLGVLFLHYGLLEKKLILAKSSYPNKNGTTTIHRLTLDADGIFRLYLHQFKSDNSSSMLIEWFALPNQCEVGGFCGFNSYCSSRGSKDECKCYPGFNFINDSNKFLGCHEKFNAYAVKIQLCYTMSLLYRICGGVISLIQLCQWIRKIVAHLAWKTLIVEQYCIRVIIAANISFRLDMVE